MTTPPDTDARTFWPSTGRGAVVLLGLGLLAGLAVRIWLALTDYSLYYADEYYQSLEPAHRLVYDYGLVTWEFTEGARSLFLPAVFAALLAVFEAIGLDSPQQYAPAMRCAMAAWSLTAIPAIYLLARRYGAGGLLAAAATLPYALGAPFTVLAFRGLSNPVATPLIIWGLALSLPSSRQAFKWERLVGPSLLALAVFVRLQNGLICLGVLAVFALSSRRRELLPRAAAVFAAWGAIFGLFEYLTWGRWFHSARVYLAHQAEHGAQVYSAAVGYYPDTLLSFFGGGVVLLACLALVGSLRARGAALIGALYIAAHVFVPHKELRFVYPALVIGCVLAGVGAQVLVEAAKKRLEGSSTRLVGWGLVATIVVCAAASELRRPGLTMGEVGLAYKTPASADIRQRDYLAGYHRLLLRAHHRADLCGLAALDIGPFWTAGYYLLHREVPYRPLEEESLSVPGQFNYAIALRDPSNPGEAVASSGAFELLRLTDAGCRETIE